MKACGSSKVKPTISTIICIGHDKRLFIGFSPSLVSYEGKASLALPVVHQVVQLGLSDGSGRRGSPQECEMVKADGSGVRFTGPRHEICDLPNPGL